MNKRKYEKKSPYWNQFHETNAALPQSGPSVAPILTGGDAYYTSSSTRLLEATASLSRRSSSSDSDRSTNRANSAAFLPTYDRFSSIKGGLLPFEYSRDGVSVRDAVLLSQKAYFNVAICRRTVDLMAEMSNTDIFLKGSSKKSRDFFHAWMKKVKIRNVAEQFFREYFRSGNVPLYRVDGEFPQEYFLKLTQIYAAEGNPTNNVPIRYIMLNPYDIVSKAATSFSVGAYEKILSRFELTRLKDPQTEEDKAFLNSLPADAQKAVREKSWQTDGVRVKLDPTKLVFCFYKKMDYEPFAVPFLYPVLDDINAKLELKKMDQAITRTVENVILLIKNGAPPDKGGINQENIRALQNIFMNSTTGRVLVSDHTTEGEFIIPDLNKVLGHEKYQVLNDDIREGLQNVLLGEEKYGNTQTKVKIFLEGLKEARNTFIDDFLQPEIKRVAKNLGFKSYPEIAMKEISASDNTQFQRVVTRLMELGLLDVRSGIQTIQNGELPDVEGEEFLAMQEQYIEERKKKNMWMPLSPVPISVAAPPPKDPNAALKADAAPAKTKPKTMKSSGRPKGAKASIQDYQQATYAAENLIHYIEESLAAKHGDLTDSQKEMAVELSKSIVCAARKSDWQSLADECLEDDSKILSLNPRGEVLDFAAESDLDLYEAALAVVAGEG